MTSHDSRPLCENCQQPYSMHGKGTLACTSGPDGVYRAPLASNPVNTTWPEFDDFACEEMRYKARGNIKRGTEVYGQASDEWVANRVRMLARTDLEFEAICSAGRDRIMRLSMEVSELRGILAARRADETPAPLTYDEFWKQVGLTGWNPSAEEMKTLLTIVGCRCTKCEYHRSAEKTTAVMGDPDAS